MQRLEYHQIIRSHLRTAYLLPEEKIDHVLPRFLESLRGLIHDLEGVGETRCLESIGRSGHAVKGALLNLGLNDLAATALILEQGCRSSDPGLDFSRLIAQLKEEIVKII
jgi:histidine phosphotransfer protein HptB